MAAKDEESIKQRPPIFRVAFKLLKEAMRELVAGECDEDEVTEMVSKLSPKSNGYKREEDYVTIDEGMKILGMGRNRAGFCQMMRENGIVNEKFNSHNIGYNKHKILALRHKMEDDYQARRAKQDRKRRRERNFNLEEEYE